MIKKKSQKAVIMQEFIKHARKTPETKPLFKQQAKSYLLWFYIHFDLT